MSLCVASGIHFEIKQFKGGQRDLSVGTELAMQAQCPDFGWLESTEKVDLRRQESVTPVFHCEKMRGDRKMVGQLAWHRQG